MLKENFKEKREELDDLLINLNVPKIYWHQLQVLNCYLSGLGISEERNNALKLLHEISPAKLTYIISEGELNAESLSEM